MEERSRAGGPIYRHEQPAPARVSAGDDGLSAAISRHVTEHYDAPDAVLLHPEESAYVDIDVHVVLPIGRTGCCRTSRGSRTSSTPCCGGVTRCPTTIRRAPTPRAPDSRAH